MKILRYPLVNCLIFLVPLSDLIKLFTVLDEVFCILVTIFAHQIDGRVILNLLVYKGYVLDSSIDFTVALVTRRGFFTIPTDGLL